MFQKYISLCLILLGGALLGSCSKGDDVQTEASRTVIVDASDYSKFNYFSFEQGKVLKLTDEQARQSDEWDICLHRYDISTNSGYTRPEGKGGGYETNETDVRRRLPLPANSAFKTDIRQVVITQFGANPSKDPKDKDNPHGMKYEWRGINPAISQVRELEGLNKDANGEYIFDGTVPTFKTKHLGAVNLVQVSIGAGSHAFSSTMSGKVYIVRTAKGRYARMKVTNYLVPVQKTITIIQNGKEKKETHTEEQRGVLTIEYVYPVLPDQR